MALGRAAQARARKVEPLERAERPQEGDALVANGAGIGVGKTRERWAEGSFGDEPLAEFVEGKLPVVV